jgi:hypothetical protein
MDEMASMLLDDTKTMLDTPEPASAKQENKNLPQLPDLLFNGDDAWAHKSRPVVTAAGNLNQIPFVESDYANDFSSQTFWDSADHSTPPIPRRVSISFQFSITTFGLGPVSLGEQKDSHHLHCLFV